MEITFTPGLDDVAQMLLDKKRKRDTEQVETVFEKYQREKKELRKQQKLTRKSKNTDAD